MVLRLLAELLLVLAEVVEQLDICLVHLASSESLLPYKLLVLVNTPLDIIVVAQVLVYITLFRDILLNSQLATVQLVSKSVDVVRQPPYLALLIELVLLHTVYKVAELLL